MAIVPEVALASKYDTLVGSYTQDDVILYHLAIGAGARPMDPQELKYARRGDLTVLPSYGVVPIIELMDTAFKAPGFDYNNIDHNSVLQGEHEIEVHGPIPSCAETRSDTRVAGVYDKGDAALVVIEVVTTDAAGSPLFTNRFSMYLRGSGGFGGQPFPRSGKITPPERKADYVVESPTLPQQALLYSLTGSHGALHTDPDFAKEGGWDRPILQGLCTYGIVCKAAVDKALNGDASRLRSFKARFAGVVFPGETVVTSLWVEEDRIIIAATTDERGEPVISNSLITFNPAA